MNFDTRDLLSLRMACWEWVVKSNLQMVWFVQHVKDKDGMSFDIYWIQDEHRIVKHTVTRAVKSMFFKTRQASFDSDRFSTLLELQLLCEKYLSQPQPAVVTHIHADELAKRVISDTMVFMKSDMETMVETAIAHFQDNIHNQHIPIQYLSEVKQCFATKISEQIASIAESKLRTVNSTTDAALLDAIARLESLMNQDFDTGAAAHATTVYRI